MLTVDTLVRSIIAVPDTSNKVRAPRDFRNRKRKRWYIKKGRNTRKELMRRINYLIYNHEKFTKQPIVQGKNIALRFITITTCQGKTNKTDSELYAILHKWLKKRKYSYINSCERQRNGDLHFHILAYVPKLDFRVEIRKLSALLGTVEHPSILDVKTVNRRTIEGVKKYLTKYTIKSSPFYTSLFTCRTWSTSRDISQCYKRDVERFVIKLIGGSKVGSNEYFFHKEHELERIRAGDYFVEYRYFDYLGVNALNLKDNSAPKITNNVGAFEPSLYDQMLRKISSNNKKQKKR